MALIDDINALPTTVGGGNTGHLNNHQVIHAGLKSHESRLASHTHTSASITDATSQAGYTSNAYANRVLRLNAEGKLNISTASITAPSDPANKIYVDTLVTSRIPETLPLRLDTTVGTRVMAGTHMVYGDTGWRDVTSLYSGSSALDMGEGGKFLIRRVNSDIVFKIVGPFSITATTGNIVQLVTGWQAHGTTLSPLASGMNILRSQYWIALQDATVGYSLPADRSIEARWLAAPQSWPTSLPGTPA